MKVIVAKTAGFCKGVKDALEITLDAIQRLQDGEKLYTFGPLIHNRQVLAMLEEKGITEENEIERCAGKQLVIRAHGIPPQTRQLLHRMDASLLDATCKRVAKVHAVIKRHARRGYHTVIVGDKDHAEVLGLLGYTEGKGRVINSPAQVEELPKEWEKVLLVAQTTQNEEVFEAIRTQFLRRYPAGIVKNTICDSTHQRQAEVRRMCSQVEAMVVVGGYHSGNTLRLAEVAREGGVPTYHVETEGDLNRQEMARYACIGVSAGASTPNWIIRNVVQFLEEIQPQRSDLGFRVRRWLETLAYANVYVALGAALLSAVVQVLLRLPGSLAGGIMSACYVFAMHSLNIYLDRSAIQLNDPGRAAFYHRWRWVFSAAGVAAVVCSLTIAMNIGLSSFLALSLLVLLGLIYAVPVIMPSAWPALKIKDIPTSKTFLVPIAWASVTVIVPHLSLMDGLFGPLLYAFWMICLLVLVRTALLDLLAVRGDRLVGRETLVVLLGEKRTVRFVMGVLGVLALSSIIGPLSGVSPPFAYLFLGVLPAYAWQLHTCSKTPYREGPLCETFIESVLIFLGGLATLSLLSG